MATINPLRCSRKELAKLLNTVGQKNGWGAVITETTINNLHNAGLPRERDGRCFYYSVLDLAAFYARRARAGEEATSDVAAQLNEQKRFEEVRRLRRENDEADGKLIAADLIVSEWQTAGAIWNGRMQALVDHMRAAGNEDGARSVESALAEMTAAVGASIEKHASTAKPAQNKRGRA